MKVSKLIKLLKDEMKYNGDLPVEIVTNGTKEDYYYSNNPTDDEPGSFSGSVYEPTGFVCSQIIEGKISKKDKETGIKNAILIEGKN